ncbi:MAG TPA: hypothetical protein VNW92_15510, partial [Polyangiaceae bacterium]|nr:hypothetical protein [Polyangiaceae bacterium]
MSRKIRRLLLVALSPARHALLLETPELVADLLQVRLTTPIPDSLELDERWIELQQALFDFNWLWHIDDVRAEALTPRTGLNLVEGSAIDCARIIPADTARRIAEWVTTLPADCIERARAAPAPSPASRGFPDSLGSTPADDDEKLREGATVFRREPARFTERELAPEL